MRGLRADGSRGLRNRRRRRSAAGILRGDGRWGDGARLWRRNGLARFVVDRAATRSYDNRQAALPTGVQALDERGVGLADKLVGPLRDGNDEGGCAVWVGRHAECDARW